MNLKWLACSLLYVALVILPGCELPARTPANAAQAPRMLPPQPSPTSMVCTADPANLSIQGILGQKEQMFQGYLLKGEGFLPDEKVHIIVAGWGVTHSFKVETLDYTVNPDGTFTLSESLQIDEANMHWQVYVVHQRGTACNSFNTGSR